MRKLGGEVERLERGAGRVLIGEVGVDSGRVLICDPCYIESEWKDEEFNIPERAVIVRKTGERFLFGKDFQRFDEALGSYGMTVNDLIEGGILDIEKLPEEEGPFTFSYDGCCKATLGEARAGQLAYKMGHAGAGVASSAGYGDGLYPVFAEYEDGRVKRLIIEFF